MLSPPPCRRCSGRAHRRTGLRGRHPARPRATDRSGSRAIGAGLPGPAGEPHRQPQQRLPEQWQSPVARPVRCRGGKRRQPGQRQSAAGGRQPTPQRCQTTPPQVRVGSYCSRLAMPGAARTNVFSVTCSTRNLARLPPGKLHAELGLSIPAHADTTISVAVLEVGDAYQCPVQVRIRD